MLHCHVRRFWTAMCDDVRPLKDELNSSFDLVVGRYAVGHNIARVCV